jgi:GGDEF domain-containing protein
LPTRVRLEAALSEKLQQRTPVALTRVNIRGFAQFNSHYGFLRGDAVLSNLGDFLREQLMVEPGTFLSHYSADDFGFLTAPDRIEAIGVQLRRAFDLHVSELYDPVDLEQGKFLTRNRRGELDLVPLMGLSVGSAVWDGEMQVSIRQLTEAAELALRSTRAKDGSNPSIRRLGSEELGQSRGKTMPINRQELLNLMASEINKAPEEPKP